MSTDIAKQKWDNIVKKTEPIVQSINNASFTPSDLSELGSIIAEQSKIASTVFDKQLKVYDQQVEKLREVVKDKLAANKIKPSENNILAVLSKLYQRLVKEDLPKLFAKIQKALLAEIEIPQVSSIQAPITRKIKPPKAKKRKSDYLDFGFDEDALYDEWVRPALKRVRQVAKTTFMEVLAILTNKQARDQAIKQAKEVPNQVKKWLTGTKAYKFFSHYGPKGLAKVGITKESVSEFGNNIRSKAADFTNKYILPEKLARVLHGKLLNRKEAVKSGFKNFGNSIYNKGLVAKNYIGSVFDDAKLWTKTTVSRGFSKLLNTVLDKRDKLKEWAGRKAQKAKDALYNKGLIAKNYLMDKYGDPALNWLGKKAGKAKARLVDKKDQAVQKLSELTDPFRQYLKERSKALRLNEKLAKVKNSKLVKAVSGYINRYKLERQKKEQRLKDWGYADGAAKLFSLFNKAVIPVVLGGLAAAGIGKFIMPIVWDGIKGLGSQLWEWVKSFLPESIRKWIDDEPPSPADLALKDSLNHLGDDNYVPPRVKPPAAKQPEAAKPESKLPDPKSFDYTKVLGDYQRMRQLSGGDPKVMAQIRSYARQQQQAKQAKIKERKASGEKFKPSGNPFASKAESKMSDTVSSKDITATVPKQPANPMAAKTTDNKALSMSAPTNLGTVPQYGKHNSDSLSLMNMAYSY